VNDRDDELAALAALAEPLRRRLYLHVAAQGSPVSREAAAAAMGVPRSVAAFHLDKLAELGLLEVEYRRPPGRRGPGAGRPAKLYRRSTKEVSFSVPERHYDVVASLLAQALLDACDHDLAPAEALAAVAHDYGRAIGREAKVGGRLSRRKLLERLTGVLAAHGYEPHLEDGVVTLCNCPFRAIAEEHRDLVCTMNVELMTGLLEALGVPEASAQLDSAPRRCCVTVRAS
jgi:predicted ArsR family transcriptional regulator